MSADVLAAAIAVDVPAVTTIPNTVDDTNTKFTNFELLIMLFASKCVLYF
ncbi:protein of unknown function [Latilactobacillus sakei]|nr:protein of unknown function [Latilactobacillus sakei]